MISVAIVFGDWSRNIGNAFFQLGGEWILRHILPNAEISLISDQPGYPSYWNPRGGNPSGFFDMAPAANPDLLVLVGPRSFVPRWRRSGLSRLISLLIKVLVWFCSVLQRCDMIGIRFADIVDFLIGTARIF